MAYRNLLLRRMPEVDLALLAPKMKRVPLALKQSLERSKQTIETVYFMESGIASVVARSPRGSDTEVGFIGWEGMTGAALVMGDDRTVHECYVQLAGEAVTVSAQALTEALSESPTLRPFLLRYVQSMHVQTGYTALVNARSTLEERLARWLLMCDDRVDGGQIAITHEFLSIMLGVRRPGVTVALQLLEGRGLIRAKRGLIFIRDRAGLIALADSGYGEPEAEYERLLGGEKPTS